MIVAAAVCPHPPLLLPGLTGVADVGADLRARCDEAVAGLLDARPDRVVVVGGAAATGVLDPGTPVDASSFGGPRGSTTGAALPLSLGVGKTLLGGAGWPGTVALQAVCFDEPGSGCLALGARLAAAAERTALLVMGDSSARRSVKAPGYVDERTAAFDAVVTRALECGDTGALAGLDAALAADLLAPGRAAWQVLAGAIGAQPVQARLLHADDPFGVLYLVATWTVAT